MFFIPILSMIVASYGIKLNVEQEWKYIDFLWDNPQQKQEAINSGDYDPVAINLFDADKATGKANITRFVLYLYNIFNG